MRFDGGLPLARRAAQHKRAPAKPLSDGAGARVTYKWDLRIR
jgi:hypothetical protein